MIGFLIGYIIGRGASSPAHEEETDINEDIADIRSSFKPEISFTMLLLAFLLGLSFLVYKSEGCDNEDRFSDSSITWCSILGEAK